MSTLADQKKFRNAVFQVDGVRVSIAMARLVHSRLWQTLTSIEPRFQAPGTFDSEIASAYSDAWTLVDARAIRYLAYTVCELVSGYVHASIDMTKREK